MNITVTYPQPEQDVCPGCGKCRQCGRHVGAPQPQWIYQEPRWLPWWNTNGTSGGTTYPKTYTVGSTA